MANFDSNSWYQITVADTVSLSLDGSTLYDHGTAGSVFFQITNTSTRGQQWQIYPFNNTFHILRTRDSGPNGFMGVVAKPGDSTTGGTVPQMVNSSLADDSVFWQINPWGDGTFYLSNAANGSDWRLLHKPNALLAMSSNITAPQPAEDFSFKTLGTIDDKRYSSVNLPSATSAPTSTTKNTSTPTGTPSSSASTSSSSSSSSGLSTGASAAIGASVGGVALILIAILTFFLLRRRRRRLNAAKENVSDNTYPVSDEYKTHYTAASELPTQSPVELPANPRSAELVGVIPSAELYGDYDNREKERMGRGGENV